MDEKFPFPETLEIFLGFPFPGVSFFFFFFAGGGVRFLKIRGFFEKIQETFSEQIF